MIFVCLGNTGEEYKNTRHNAGKKFGEFLLKKFECSNVRKFKKGRIVELENGWWIVFLDCLMNSSGECLKKILARKNTEINGITRKFFVVHDDMDIEFGEFKIQKNRGTAGHKGVQSIIDALGTQDFGRIRIGIGRPPENIPPEKYVLMHFTKEERAKLEKTFEDIYKQLSR